MSYKFGGTIVGTREGERIWTPSGAGDGSTRVPGPGPAYFVTVWLPFADSPGIEVELPWGLLPVELGMHVEVEIGLV